jgi:hypothetical protein
MAVVEERKEGSFCMEGDSRIRNCYLRHRLDFMYNMSISFDPATMMCFGYKERGPHCKLGGLGREVMVLVASDQGFPATLHSKDKENCIGILRIEDGSLKELSFAVEELLEGERPPPRAVWCFWDPSPTWLG